jgi:3-deoxy-manno-octulosonate cytidylyltransferase (CMP-KDO synthetase)
MKIVIVIPARFKSTRYPGKPLIDILGKSMIQRVYEKCVLAFPKEFIFVATEDERIINHCDEYGMQCILTSDNCLTGTDRIAEVAKIIDADYYVNVQGDEPLFNPEDIKYLINKIPEHKGEIINGYCSIDNEIDYRSVSTPKVVFRPDGRLLYMSRSPIPGNKLNKFNFSFRQVCAYAFPKSALLAFSAHNNKTLLEEVEDIEILRFLELGYDVRMLEMSNVSIPIDNPEDLVKVITKLQNVG